MTLAGVLFAATPVWGQAPERQPGQRPGGDRPQFNAAEFIQRIQGYDENNDGKITSAELPERMRGILVRLDSNQDGAIDNKELAALKERLNQPGQRPEGQPGQRPEGQPGQRPEGQPGQRPERQPGQRPQFNPAEMIQRIKDADKNKDGKITKAELPEQMQRMMERMDTNQDGVIDSEELKAVEQRFAQRAQGQPGQRPQGQPGQRPQGQPGQRPQGQPGQRPQGQPGQRPQGQQRGLPPLPVLQALDTNQDGEISQAEINNAVKSLKTLDKDGNGKLTMEELMPAFGGRGGGQGNRPGQFGGGGRPDGPPGNQPTDRPQRPTRPE